MNAKRPSDDPPPSADRAASRSAPVAKADHHAPSAQISLALYSAGFRPVGDISLLGAIFEPVRRAYGKDEVEVVLGTYVALPRTESRVSPRARAKSVASWFCGEVQDGFPIQHVMGRLIIIGNPAERIIDLLTNISSEQNQLFVACNCHRSERCPIINPDLLINVMEVNLHGTL
jgi:hypothetical protein